MPKIDLNEEDIKLIVTALEGIEERGVLASLISESKALAIAQRVEQLKKKLQPNEDENTN